MIELAPASTDVILNWKDANLYCFALNIDGKTGWRLPTMDEMIDISQIVNSTLIVPSAYWTSLKAESRYVSIPSIDEEYCNYGVYTVPLNSIWAARFDGEHKHYRVRAVRDI